MNKRLTSLTVALAAFVTGGVLSCTGTASEAAEPVGSFVMSVSAGPVGTLVRLTGNAGTGCPSGQPSQPSIVFQRRGQTTPLDILYMAVDPSGSWAAQFVIPSYLPPYNSAGEESVNPGPYQFSVQNCEYGYTTKPFSVTGGSAVTPHNFVGIAARSDGRGYWLAQASGGVYSFGDAPFYGSLPPGPGGLGITPAAPITGIASTPDGGGYWLVGADGGVFSFGDAGFYGSLPANRISPIAPIAGIASTSDGGGYWLVGADGGVFAFGDAPFQGAGPTPDPKVAIVAQGPTYAVVSSDGDVDSHFGLDYGGTPNLAATIMQAAATPDRRGIWEVGADGGVITFADAVFYGSLPGEHISPVAPPDGIAPTPDGGGYWLVARDGGVFAFGDAAFYGSAA